MSQVQKMSEKMEGKIEVDRELDEHNARLAKINLKMAERLAERLAEYRINTLIIEGLMIACGTSILGYFGGNVMTVNDITTIEEIGAAGYRIGLFMRKQ